MAIALATTAATRRRVRHALIAALVALATPPLAAQGTTIGFEETFALATDRLATLDELTPGTAQAYRYTCLALQHAGELDRVAAVLEQWEARHGRSHDLEVVEHRQALLAFGQDPAHTYRHLRRHLELRLDHQRQVPGAEPDLPTRLDPARLDWDALADRALEHHGGRLRGVRDRALPRLLARDLDDAQLHELLGRLERPDVDGLPELIVHHLRSRHGRGFGQLRIHTAMTRAQLDACADLEPSLLGASAFVAAYVERLHPPSHVDWRHDPDAREAYLEQLETFARRLPGSQDGFLAHVLYHRLAHDHARGVHDRQRLLDYLALHRDGGWVDPDHLRNRSHDEAYVSLDESYPTGFPPIRDDESLLRALLEHDFRTADDYARYVPYLRVEVLRRIFAETKILYGVGDPERWSAMLDDPAAYEALVRRVEIEFAATQPERFAVDEAVALDVDVKNVGLLLVEVFEIDALGIYAETGEEIDASLDLDGLVAHEAATYTWDAPPHRRVRRRLELPSLEGPGVWIVEIVGNGVSSRAVVRKGSLSARERLGPAGHVFTVFDERGTPLPDASIRFGGRDFAADEDGGIVVPYSTSGGPRTLVLHHGDRATLRAFVHEEEEYALGLSAWTEREALLPGRTARLVVRPQLRLNGHPVTLELLTEPVLTLTATHGDDVTTTTEVTDMAPSDDAELVHELTVPEGLVSLTVGLRGTVRVASRAQDVALQAAAPVFRSSGIRATHETTAAMLARAPDGYRLEVRGLGGEPIPSHPVRLALRHEDFRDEVTAQLETDARGRVALGALPGIRAVRLLDHPGARDAWELVPARRSVPRRVHARPGETIRVPHDGIARDDRPRALASLLERRGDAFVRDRGDHLALAGDVIELRDLPAGEYSLRLSASGREVDVRVAPGTLHEGWVVGDAAIVPLDDVAPLHVAGLSEEDGTLAVRLGHAGPDARVHLTATRWLPAYHPYDRMFGEPARDAAAVATPVIPSSYLSGRRLDDEARYILERRLATTFAGNMLARPTLLLNPWALPASETVPGGGGGGGGGFGKAGRRAGGASRAAPPPADEHDRVAPGPGEHADLAFLPKPAPVLANLRPDADGVVRVPRADLGPGHLVHVIATDAETTAYRSLALEPAPLEPRDVRLREGLPADAHVAEQRRVEVVPGGTTALVEDPATARLELYDSLADVFGLYATLDASGDLAAWRVLLDWPALTREEKLARYDELACHELHLFVHEKDPAFFEEVLRPYLANKTAKTFMDRWLLDEDLSAYLRPYAFSRLNVLERILLARRLPEHAEAIGRRIASEVERVPDDPARERRLFETLLAGSALEADGGLARAVREAREEAPPGAARQDAAAPPAEAAGADLMTGLARQRVVEDAPGAAPAPFHRDPGPVEAFVEHDYWHRRVHEQDASLLTPNAFWLDLARTPPGEPFLSTHLVEATRHVNEMLLALALLDLPFDADETVSRTADGRLAITPGRAALLVRRALRPAPADEDGATVLVGQRIVRLEPGGGPGDDDRVEDGALRTGVAYATEVVVSNPSTEPLALELLVQIPEGAIPVGGDPATRGLDLRLEPLESGRHLLAFYVPRPGDVAMYPAHVSRDGRFVAAAEPRTLHVVAEPAGVDEASWAHVSQSGTLEQVLAFLEDAGPARLDLPRIAWRMRDRDAFDRVLGALRARHVFDRTLWGYALHHEDARATAELLEMESDFLARCGPALDSPLVTIDPVERGLYEHVEFAPFVNERAHPFGGTRRILNPDVARQYARLLSVLVHTPRLDEADWLEVTYSLLLQDRVEEALEAFARVDRAAVGGGLQYDYAAAYLAVSTADRARARRLAEPHREHPVPRWRVRFLDVLHQLDEAEDGAFAAADPDDRVQGQTALAAARPSLELDVSGGRVTLRHENLEGCELGFYAMDVEFLFSSDPFAQAGGDAFAAIRPNHVERIALDADADRTVVEMPGAFAAGNVVVEARGGGVVRRRTRYAHDMTVRMIETHGQLRVTDARGDAPLPGAYVKVYARTSDGGVRFHKDGYTDLRGRFDYVAHSARGIAPAETYAVLVASEDHGAVIRQVGAPAE